MNQTHQMDAYRIRLKEMISNCPKLKLEVISSASLPKGQVITINSQGLYGNYISDREKSQPGTANDGYTYFGSMNYVIENQFDGQPHHDENDPNGKRVIVNDFVIPSRNQEASE